MFCFDCNFCAYIFGFFFWFTLKYTMILHCHRYFNSLQSECFPCCFFSDVNMVISAPTGSGKTVLFELCILRLLSRSLSADGRFIHAKGTLKTVNYHWFIELLQFFQVNTKWKKTSFY